MNEAQDDIMPDRARKPARRRLALGIGALIGSTLLGGAGGAYVTRQSAGEGPATAVEHGETILQRTAFTNPSTPLADMVEAVSPAVVQVQAHHGSTQPSGTGFDDRFERFNFGRGAPAAAAPAASLGSGFVVDARGLIVTNAHVVRGADRINIKLHDGREFPASVVGRDDKTDLAVLSVKAGKLSAVSWGNSEALRVGADVVAVGSPFGLGNTVTKGIVSGLGRAIGAGPYDDFLQIDAAINSGNSGGPLFDASGHVVGVNTAIYSPSGGNVGIGFAIPSVMAREVVTQLAAKGSVSRGQIGIAIEEVTPEAADSLGLSNAKGALVAAVAPGSPAARAGLRPGDVVRSFGGAALDGPSDLSRAVAAARIGETVPLIVLRDGRMRTVPVDIVRQSYQAGSDGVVADARPITPRLGLQVAAASPELNADAGHPTQTKGVLIIAVDPNGKAAARGLAQGDLIISLNAEHVASPQALASGVQRAAVAGRRHVLLDVLRAGQRALVVVPLV